MRRLCLASTALLVAVALAPTAPRAQQAAPGPYQAVPVTFAKPLGDPTLEAFRKELTEIAQKKDRAALAGKVVAKGFFWEREDTNVADPKKSGIDNLEAALGLDAKDGSGWELLAIYLADPTAEQVTENKDVVCSPAAPAYSEKDFEQLIQTTNSDPTEWAYPTAAGLEMRAKPDSKSPVVEKLAATLLRMYPDETQPEAAADWMRLVAPSGKLGYALVSAMMPLVSDQLCYVKEGTGWRIAGYRGGATDQ